MDSATLWGGIGYFLAALALGAALFAGVFWLQVAKTAGSVDHKNAARMTGYAFLLAVSAIVLIVLAAAG